MATLLGALGTRWLRKLAPLAPLPPIVLNALIVGTYLVYLLPQPVAPTPYWESMLAVAIGIGSTLAMAQPRSDMLTISTPTLNGQTLASTYIALASGAAR